MPPSPSLPAPPPASRAVLVGLEKYRVHTLHGPVAEALLVAQALQAAGVDPARIDLWLAPADAESTQRADASGRPWRLFDAQDFSDFLVDELAVDAAGGTLYLHWCGHGVASDGQHHLLLPRSSVTQLESLELDALARLLVDSRHTSFGHLVLVLDTCREAVLDWGHAALAPQPLVAQGRANGPVYCKLFVCAEGQTTSFTQTGSVRGALLRQVIAEATTNGWPDFKTKLRDVAARLETAAYVHATDWTDQPLDRVSSSDPPIFVDLMPRTSLVAQIETAAREAPVVAVGGLSGTGKTYAVSEFVRAMDVPMRPSSVMWYDASPKDSLEDLLLEVGQRVGLKSASTHARCKELCAILRATSQLLVVDDFHNVDLESYRPLLNAALRQGSPAILLVVTQRDAIISSSARMVIAERFSINEIQRYLDHRGVSGISKLMVASLATATAGLPFAVALFCTLVTHFGENPLGLLSRQLHTEGVIAQWFKTIADKLSEESLKMISLLSLVGESFNLGIAKLAAKLGSVHQPDSALRDLQSAFLLQRCSPYRWAVHDLVSARFGDMVELEVRDSVYLALSRHFQRGYPRRGAKEVLTDDEFQWKARALEQLLRADSLPSSAVRLFTSLISTAKAKGRYSFVIAAGEAIRLAAPTADKWIDYHVAHAYYISGDFSKSHHLMDSLMRADPLNDPTLELACRRLASEAMAATGKLSEARSMLSRALDELHADSVKPITRSQALSQLAVMDLKLGHFESAKQVAEVLLADSAKGNDRRGAAIALSLLGGAEMKADRLEIARGHLEQSSTLFADCQDRRGFVWATAQLAECLISLRDQAAAVPLLLDAAHTAADIGEWSPDYFSLLERIDAIATDSTLRSCIEFERARVADWLES